jgi:hypothetical protein
MDLLMLSYFCKLTNQMQNMKNTFFLLLSLSLILFSSCKKDSSLFSATITGEDPRTCICCGGYWIQIGNETRLCSEIVANNIVKPQVAFPIKVCIDTAKNYVFCGGSVKSINITKIELEK